MRNLTQREALMINGDIIPFKQFLIKNGLYTDAVKNKYSKLKFGIESQEVLKGANGITNDDNTIAIKDSVFYNDNNERALTLYHELGHALFGIRRLSEDKYNYLLTEIVTTQKENRDILPLEPVVYFRGLNCLEEYMAEKFGQTIGFYAKGINVSPKVSLSTPGICGDYKYYSTFKSNYGIFESQCDVIVYKFFGSTNNAIKSALNETFFSTFFQAQNKISMMKLLGNLGQIHGAIQKFHGYNRTGVDSGYDPNYIKELLEETTIMANNLSENLLQQNVTGMHR